MILELKSSKKIDLAKIPRFVLNLFTFRLKSRISACVRQKFCSLVWVPHIISVVIPAIGTCTCRVHLSTILGIFVEKSAMRSFVLRLQTQVILWKSVLEIDFHRNEVFRICPDKKNITNPIRWLFCRSFHCYSFSVSVTLSLL